MKKKKILDSRREFLKSASLASAGFMIVPRHVLGGKGFLAPSDKLVVAGIGVGGKGKSDLKYFYDSGKADIGYLCDVDDRMAKGSIAAYPKAKYYKDWRKMMEVESKNFDAVSVSTPDHNHAVQAMAAMQLGKHVYVQKPMTHDIFEARMLTQAAAKYKVVTQMGNQGHSEANYFQFKAWKEAGIIKDVTAITAHMNSARRWHAFDPKIKSLPAKEAIPTTLDWDTWHGVVKEHDYNHDYHNGQWRCWYDFGMGALGDWGAHLIDTAHQFLDLGLPNEISMVRADQHNPFFYPFSSTILFKFPERKGMPACDITWYDGLNNLPPLPEGYGSSAKLDSNIPAPSNGAIQSQKLNPGKIIYSKDLIFKGGSHGSTLSIIPEEKGREMASRLPEVPVSPSNHYANFLKACLGQEETRSPFAIAGPLSQVFCLGVLSQMLNTTLKFDRKKKQITNNKLANQLLVGEPPRKGWEQYYKM